MTKDAAQRRRWTFYEAVIHKLPLDLPDRAGIGCYKALECFKKSPLRFE